MEEKKQTLTKLRVSFPHRKLTPQQEQALLHSLKSAVVAVLPGMLEDQVIVQPKVNGWEDR